MDYKDNVNPWSLFQGDDVAPKSICNSAIDNRFPNNFRKSSSLVTCNFCNVILLKNQTQQHFKIHHNKKFKKKFSKFKIPFNAVEGYAVICEIRRKKLASTSSISRTNRSKELFKLKHKHSEGTFTKQSNKTPSNLLKKVQKDSKSFEFSSPKLTLVPGKLSAKNNEFVDTNAEDDIKRVRKSVQNRKTDLKLESRKLTKRSILTTAEINNKRLKSNDLKLNIRINCNGLLTSSIKGEISNCPNIFDRMSHFYDDTSKEKDSGQTTIPSRGIIKQSGFDESYGCTIFTDEFNNSILIDNDKDEPEDFDCCESSLSNDSAYFSLPNTTANSITTTSAQSTKSSNLSDSSIAPPLVTAYQYSNSTTNKVTYCTNDSHSKDQSKTTPMTMHVTRSLSYNSIVPPKSTVKHRFYVSGHSNQTIINTLRRKRNDNSDCSYGIENENFESIGGLHGLSKESEDISYFEESQSSCHKQKHPVNSKSFTNVIKDVIDNRFWNYFEGNGLSVSYLIPKRLNWTQSRSRRKNMAQLNVVKTKQSPKTIVPKQLNRSTVPVPVSENPLLTSYTMETNDIVDVLQSDPMLTTSDIVLDYQFPDRNQMSFQQRLLERGVISHRDIARSQRCISFNPSYRKFVKPNSLKPNVVEYNRIQSTNKNCPMKTQIVCHTGYNSVSTNSYNICQNKPTVVHQPKIHSTSAISHDPKVNSVTKQGMFNRKQAWCEDVNIPRNQNASTFHGQCLSQTGKYINRKILASPRQNRNTVICAVTRSVDSQSTSTLFQSTVTNPSTILHPNNSTFHSISAAQNMFTNDSSIRYSQQPMEGQYIHIGANNISHRYKKPDNEFINYRQSCDEVNKSYVVPHSNYQTMYNPQIKFANNSASIYNANFEL